ncbi:MAG: cytidine deaminase [Coraliomargarita sp.]
MTLDSHDFETALNNIEATERHHLLRELKSPNFCGYLRGTKQPPEQLAPQLLELAKCFAETPVSGFHVGAVALGSSGRIYLGANLEFSGAPLSASLHAEQSAILNAWMHGEPSIERLIVSETPCGHCRQFLNELSEVEQLVIEFGGAAYKLWDLLPQAFGSTRKAGHGLLDSPSKQLACIRPVQGDLHQRAINAAERSYVPYSEGYAGFALTCTDGKTYGGRSAESAAFNPSVPAVTCALNQRNLSSSRDWNICAATQSQLATAVHSQYEFAETILRRITSASVEKVLIEVV